MSPYIFLYMYIYIFIYICIYIYAPQSVQGGRPPPRRDLQAVRLESPSTRGTLFGAPATTPHPPNHNNGIAGINVEGWHFIMPPI